MHGMEALAASRELLEYTVNALDTGLAVFDADFRLLFWNRAYAEITHLPAELLQVGTTLEDLLGVAVRDGFVCGESGEDPEARRFPRPGGGMVFTLKDISQARRAEQALRESQRALAALMSDLPGMVYRCHYHEQWPLDFASEGCLALTGFQPSELVGGRNRGLLQLIHPADREYCRENVALALRECRAYQLRYRIDGADSEERWVLDHGHGVSDESGTLVALEGFISDITESQRLAETLDHQSYHDALTGLLNRQALEARLDELRGCSGGIFPRGMPSPGSVAMNLRCCWPTVLGSGPSS